MSKDLHLILLGLLSIVLIFSGLFCVVFAFIAHLNSCLLISPFYIGTFNPLFLLLYLGFIPFIIGHVLLYGCIFKTIENKE